MKTTATLSRVISTAYLFVALFSTSVSAQNFQWREGGIVRGDNQKRNIALVFTADEWNDGAAAILTALSDAHVKGNFFLTGKYYERFPDDIRRMVRGGHYVGTHGYGHLLYVPWERRDTTLVSREAFVEDLDKGYKKMAEYGIRRKRTPYFIPSYEHYNKTISQWASEIGLQVICQTYGPRTAADYTIPSMKSYASSDELYDGLMAYETKNGLNGYLLLVHLGTHPDRTDKFYWRLPQIITELKARGYRFVTVTQLLGKRPKK